MSPTNLPFLRRRRSVALLPASVVDALRSLSPEALAAFRLDPVRTMRALARDRVILERTRADVMRRILAAQSVPQLETFILRLASDIVRKREAAARTAHKRED